MATSLSPTSAIDGPRLGLPNFAFIGKAGAGKSTAAAALKQRDHNGATGYYLASFAAPLKAMAVKLWGPGADRDRDKLQRLGNAVREIDEDAWVNLWRKDVERVGCPIVTDDLRFPNEWWAAKAEGFVIVRILASREQRIARLTAIGKLQDESQLEHISETALDDFEADYTLDGSGSPVDLAEQVYDVLGRETRRR